MDRQVTLLAGVARADITPPVGIDLGGFYTRIGPSTHVLDPLTATALLLRCGKTGVLIVSCDLLSFRGELGLEVRRVMADAVSLPAENVLLAASHTHSGPVLGAHLRNSLHTGEELPIAYRTNLLNVLTGLAQMAILDLQPARLAPGEGRADIGVNRRERVPSGRIVIGMNADGPADDMVGVLRVDALDGSPLAVVVNYTCHPIVLGPQSRAISADYPGVMRRVVETAVGAPCLFTQGACGDMGPVCGEDAGPSAVHRLGSILGHEAARVYWSLDPRSVERHKVIFESVAPLTNVIETPLPEPRHHLMATERTVDLPLQEPPSRDEVQRMLAHLTKSLSVEAHTDSGRIARARVEVQCAWYTFLLELYQQGPLPQTIPVPVSALRLDSVGIVSLPLEPFAGIALAIKADSPAPHTWVVGYSHGCAGYVPSPQAHVEGGYEVETSYKLYRLPAPFAPEAYDRLIASGRALLSTLFPPTAGKEAYCDRK